MSNRFMKENDEDEIPHHLKGDCNLIVIVIVMP